MGVPSGLLHRPPGAITRKLLRFQEPEQARELVFRWLWLWLSLV